MNRHRQEAFDCDSRREFQSVISIAEDREGRLWLGRIGGVAFLNNGLVTDLSERLGFSDTNIRAILQDRTGAMWFGTESRGLVRFRDGAITVYKTPDGLAGNAIKAIIEDRKGNVWIGTYGGLSRFAHERFDSWTVADGLASNKVRSLYEDRDGTIWIGTYDGGLSRFKDGKITSFTTNDGLFNNGVFQILEDNRGNFWMSCNLGIYRVSRDGLNDYAEGKGGSITCVPYGKYDGLVNVECNGGAQPAGVRASDGRLWFPTLGGVAVVDPENIPQNPQAPPIVIEGCTLDHKPVGFAGIIEIGPARQSLEIQYTALSFIKSEHIRFRYKLEGLDPDWIDVGTRRAAYYSYLPPGSYIFTVTAANADGVWNTEGASILIKVVPPFYRTWWFAAVVAVAVLALGALIYEWRLLQLKRAKSAQEEFSRRLIDFQENERKRIAAELHDSLGQSLAIIKNRALLGLNTPADEELSKDQFNRITEHAAQAINEVKDISYNLRPYLLDRLGLTRALGSMLTKVAGSSGIRFDEDIDELDGLFSKDEEISLYRIVQESVNNIIKHSEATEAMVVIKKEAGEVAITVQDNGKGFAPEAADGGPSRHGFGLIGMAERARILGARQEIHSGPGHGTTITLKLSLKDRCTEKGDEK
jgi:signal transduction histidine kinase/streptogramin lyase